MYTFKLPKPGRHETGTRHQGLCQHMFYSRPYQLAERALRNQATFELACWNGPKHTQLAMSTKGVC